MTITEFIEARIAGDEAAAHASIEAAEMYPYGDRKLPRLAVEDVPDQVRGYLGGTWGEHFARHDPARVLAECAAKRQMLAKIPRMGDPYDGPGTSIYVLQCLASVYKDHPDYRQEWAIGN
jgi:hypothetical protein